ncbi:uncharacterized protein LOC110878550 isoform X2 [Helianthus annuus]|uniref:uncharacterized protein LOC110878550 isoform X2 n=1 Tax=Helianthus annuus TaxID=4232 RepID=UPI001652CBDC|nr:uncharacterized protein LOC110878550 isoform X2 [Helianthus annuus]
MADHNFSEDENNDQEQLHGPEKDKATGNVYMEARLARIQENQKRLRELGVKNVVDSMTSLVDSNKMKKKPVKRNTRAGDVDYIPDPGEDSGDDCEEDNQQVGRSIVVPKKRHHSQYIPPMSMSRTANLTKLRRVLAPNVSQKVLSTSNATKPNKEVAKRRMIDDEDEEIFQGNKVDMEVDGADEMMSMESWQIPTILKMKTIIKNNCMALEKIKQQVLPKRLEVIPKRPKYGK